MSFFEMFEEPWNKMLFFGIALLLIGGGITLWSYTNRDPVSGQFYYTPKLLIAGVVFTVMGLIGRNMARNW